MLAIFLVTIWIDTISKRLLGYLGSLFRRVSLRKSILVFRMQNFNHVLQCDWMLYLYMPFPREEIGKSWVDFRMRLLWLLLIARMLSVRELFLTRHEKRLAAFHLLLIVILSQMVPSDFFDELLPACNNIIIMPTFLILLLYVAICRHLLVNGATRVLRDGWRYSERVFLVAEKRWFMLCIDTSIWFEIVWHICVTRFPELTRRNHFWV